MEKVAMVLVFVYASLTMSMVRGTFMLNLKAQEKISHLRFYIQDVTTGPNSTVVTVAQGPQSQKSPTGFGTVNVIDDPLTEGPQPTSNLIGRAQGTATFIGKDKIAFLLAINFVFTSGEFNGSSLTMLGRNAPYLPVRELPIVGGSGVFRLARGFVTTKTHQFNATTGNGVYEYNVVAIHY